MNGALLQLFDTYSLRARLQPALLTLLPLLITIAAWFPAAYEEAPALAGLAAACGLAMLLAQIARQRGRMAEEHLCSVWGGTPTTIWLRHSDHHLDSQTRARYHTFLARRIPGWQPATPEEERERPLETDVRYDSAGRWLRERTRDKGRFPIIFQENVSYGFRRNTYGLKSTGVGLAAISAGLNAALLYSQLELMQTPNPVLGVAALAFSILSLIVWFVVVRPTWVRDAADAYSRALLASCDELAGDLTAPQVT